jgi:RAB6A-GEF complex partner protein 1
MSVINPDSDGWQSVKVNSLADRCPDHFTHILITQYPMMYISTNWPIRYATISIDGTLIAIAGRYGLTHFSSISGRWKLFRDEAEENEITVHGGLLWYHHVLVAAVETDHGNEVRGM